MINFSQVQQRLLIKELTFQRDEKFINNIGSNNIIMANSNTKIGGLIAAGVLLRVLFILYLSKFESIMKQQLSGTDIDYKVYTDAAYKESPYLRHTYRYTPLIAYMMRYNHVVQYAGKLWFVFFDAFAMLGLAVAVRRSCRGPVVALYALNPLLIYLTVRGSCESISLALMYACFYFIFQGNGNTIFEDNLNKKVKVEDNRKCPWLGYILYGLWVHVRVYPIVLLPLILIHERKICLRTSSSFLLRFLKIGLISGGTFFLLLGYFFIKYGEPFIQETYLYHLTRLDNRHSFSPFFYEIYLNLNTQSIMRSMAQLCVIVAVTRRLHTSMSPYYAHFIITYAFVSFNKVITMQYYMWVFGALLLVLSESTLLTNSHRRFQKTFSYVMQYSLGILLWVWASIKLEKQGENVFNLMWFICVAKLFSDFWAVSGFMSTIRNKLGYQAIPGEEQKVESSTALNQSKTKFKV